MRLDEVQHKEMEAAIEPDTTFIAKALNGIKDLIIASDDPRRVLNAAFEPFDVFFSRTKGESKLPQHDEVGIVRAVTSGDGGIEIQMESDLRDVFKDDSLWDDVIQTFSEVIGHELIHRQQFADIAAGEDTFEKPEADKDPKQEYKNYLANRHEILAYAYQSVEELNNDGFSFESIAALVNDPTGATNPSAKDSGMFTRYLENFEVDSEEFQIFLGHMREYIKELSDDGNGNNDTKD